MPRGVLGLRAALASALLAYFGVSALKVFPEGHAADSEATADPHQHRLSSFDAHAAQVVRGISNFTEWSLLWRQMASTDERVNTSLEEGALVLGVFSTAWATEHQMVIRDTWMKQKGVCNLMDKDVPRAGCSVYVAFVMGRLGSSHYPDEVPLHDALYLEYMDENMNAGKTPMFFYIAARQFPWATHIAKVDMDAFPFVHKLVSHLYGERRCSAKYEYWGVTVGRKQCDWTPHWSFSEACPVGSCMKEQPCADQMDGGMYGLSRDLAFEATEPGTPWSNVPGGGGEDGVTGNRLHQWSRKYQKCVSQWLIDDSHFHLARQKPRTS